MQVRGDTERGTPADIRVRGRAEEEVGGDMGRQGILRRGHKIFEKPGRRRERGGRGKSRSGVISFAEERGGVWFMYVVAIRGGGGVGVAQRSNNLAGSPPGDAPPRHVP